MRKKSAIDSQSSMFGKHRKRLLDLSDVGYEVKTSCCGGRSYAPNAVSEIKVHPAMFNHACKPPSGKVTGSSCFETETVMSGYGYRKQGRGKSKDGSEMG